MVHASTDLLAKSAARSPRQPRVELVKEAPPWQVPEKPSVSSSLEAPRFGRSAPPPASAPRGHFCESHGEIEDLTALEPKKEPLPDFEETKRDLQEGQDEALLSPSARRRSLTGGRRMSTTGRPNLAGRRGSISNAGQMRRSSIAANLDKGLPIAGMAEDGDSDFGPSSSSSDVVAAAQEAKEDRRAKRLQVYAEGLLDSEQLKERQEQVHDDEDSEDEDASRQVEVREVAHLFVEFDGALTGFIFSHDLRSLMRRAGRALSAAETNSLLDNLAPDWNEEDMEGGLDFIEVLELIRVRRHAEKAYLKTVYVDRFQAQAGDPGGRVRPDFRALATALEGVTIHVMPELVRRAATDLGLPTDGGVVTMTRETQLYRLAERCRMFEKQRVHGRAMFPLEKVSQFQQIYDRSVARLEKGASVEEFIMMLDRFGMHVESDAEREMMEEIFFCGRGTSARLRFWDCLHAVRRMDELAAELNAAEEELNGFRDFFKQLIVEDGTDVQEAEFTYFTLSKAVRIMGATLTMEKNGELEQIFRQKAIPSRSYGSLRDKNTVSALQLRFPEFLLVIGHIFKQDFAGITT
ncbi:unnamed protein product, partial [Polarella glacialis]